MLVLIPARGGSKGLPGKNLRLVGGISLVGRAVLDGLEFCHAHGGDGDIVLVDTDDAAIAREALAWGAAVPFLRPSRLAQDDTPTIASTLAAIERTRLEIGAVDQVLLLQPTSPLRSVQDIAGAVEAFAAGTCESVVSVVECEHRPDLSLLIDEQQGGSVHWAFGAPGATRRQDAARMYRPNGAVYLNTTDFLERERAFVVQGHTHCYEMPGNRSVDVDSELDLELADFLTRLAARRAADRSAAPAHGVVLRNVTAAAIQRMAAIGAAFIVQAGPQATLDGQLEAAALAAHGLNVPLYVHLSGLQHLPTAMADSIGVAVRVDERNDLEWAESQKGFRRSLLLIYRRGGEAACYAAARQVRSSGGTPRILLDCVAEQHGVDAVSSVGALGQRLGLSSGAMVIRGSREHGALAAEGAQAAVVAADHKNELDELSTALAPGASRKSRPRPGGVGE